jgi:hypothetical protein
MDTVEENKTGKLALRKFQTNQIYSSNNSLHNFQYSSNPSHHTQQNIKNITTHKFNLNSSKTNFLIQNSSVHLKQTSKK